MLLLMLRIFFMAERKVWAGKLITKNSSDISGENILQARFFIMEGLNLTVLARGERTAREIRQLVKGDFRDFSRLKKELEFLEK